jgi:S-adenosylmethionine:tRNA ribosyltransferase-isomerase
MQLSDFDFPFDPELIADRPAEPRDRARLLVVPRYGGGCTHHHIADLPMLLRSNDLIVVNDTKVMPVRLSGRKRPGGGRVELVLVREIGTGTWEALVKGGGKPGQVIDLAPDASVTVIQCSEAYTTVKLSSARPIHELLQRIGHMPLPPYIKRSPHDGDRVWYQTVFARSEGAVAAPTAGLHFTNELLGMLSERGIETATITLHVGPATFRPVKANRIEDHAMPPEHIEVPQKTADGIARTKACGGRIVAVGTTVVRTLEAAVSEDGSVHPMKGESSLFIFPGYRFRVVDALLTNFHLPRTTLLMLVSAFTGLERLRTAYAESVKERYRFYSYGDAMLIF